MVMPTWASLTHAIVISGHAVYHGGPTLSQAQASLDQHWFLQSFQKGEAPDYITHIRRGVEVCASDPSALLIFSGGQTRTPHMISESQSYHQIAEIFDFWGHDQVRQRVTTEEFARDSYDNMLFGIARFAECVGKYPQRLSVISWQFKRARVLFHAATLHWPITTFRFIGDTEPEDIDGARKAEKKTLIAFQADVTGSKLTEGGLGCKKNLRNPYRRHHGYNTSCPTLAPLLAWKGASPISKDAVPWASC